MHSFCSLPEVFGSSQGKHSENNKSKCLSSLLKTRIYCAFYFKYLFWGWERQAQKIPTNLSLAIISSWQSLTRCEDTLKISEFGGLRQKYHVFENNLDHIARLCLKTNVIRVHYTMSRWMMTHPYTYKQLYLDSNLGLKKSKVWEFGREKCLRHLGGIWRDLWTNYDTLYTRVKFFQRKSP